MDAFLAGAAEGHSDGAWCYNVQKHIQEEDEFFSFPAQRQPTAKVPSSFGPEWRAVVQGKFRVHTRGIDGEKVLGHGAWDERNRYVDLFTSEAFKSAVATHREAEKCNPRRSPVEKRSTLKFPGLWDKRNFVWYTDEDGVEHKTNDLIQFLPVPPESNYDPRYNIPLLVHFIKGN